MKVLFIAGFGPVSADVAGSRRLYEEALGIAFKTDDGQYLHTDELEGARYFAIWPLSQAAESCFGTPDWPADMVRPQAWIEFDVEDVEEATRELEERGFTVLLRNRQEPWGQTVTRLVSPEGLLVGVTVTPWMRDKT